MFEKRHLRKHGTRGQATVVDAQQHPKVATNDWRKYDFIVDVRASEQAPFRAELQETFLIGGLKPEQGDIVNVIFDRSSHAVMFDLDGDVRYDLDAQGAQRREARAQLLREPPSQT
jgi:hypothetical protein